jgi:hypothetical protein
VIEVEPNLGVFFTIVGVQAFRVILTLVGDYQVKYLPCGVFTRVCHHFLQLFELRIEYDFNGLVGPISDRNPFARVSQISDDQCVNLFVLFRENEPEVASCVGDSAYVRILQKDMRENDRLPGTPFANVPLDRRDLTPRNCRDRDAYQSYENAG